MTIFLLFVNCDYISIKNILGSNNNYQQRGKKMVKDRSIFINMIQAQKVIGRNFWGFP